MARGTGVFMPRCYSELSRTAQGSNNSPAVGSATPESQDGSSQATLVIIAPDQRDSCGGSAVAQPDNVYHKQMISSIKGPARTYSAQTDHQPAQPRPGVTVRRVPWQKQPQAHSSSSSGGTSSWPGVAGIQCMQHAPAPPPPPPPPPSVPAPAGGSPRYSSLGKSSSSSFSTAGIANHGRPLRPGTHFGTAGNTPLSTAKDSTQGQPRLSITDSISSAFASSLNRASVSSWDGLDSPCNAASATDLAALGNAVPAAAPGGVWGLQHQESLDPTLMFDTGAPSCPMLQLLQGAGAAADEAAATPAAAAAAAAAASVDGILSSPGGCFSHGGSMSHSWAEQGRLLTSHSFTGGQLPFAHEPLGVHSNSSRLGGAHCNSSSLLLSSSVPNVNYLSAPLPSAGTQLCNSSSSGMLFQSQVAPDMHPAGTSPVADTLEVLLGQQLAAVRAAAGANTGVAASTAPSLASHRQSSFGSMSASLLGTSLGTSMDDFASAVVLSGGSPVLWGNELTLQQHLQLSDTTLGMPSAGGAASCTCTRSLSGPCHMRVGLEAGPVPSALHRSPVVPVSALHSSGSQGSAGLQGLPMQMLATGQHNGSAAGGADSSSSSGGGGNLMAVAQLKLQQLMAVEQMQQQLQEEVMRLLPLI